MTANGSKQTPHNMRRIAIVITVGVILISILGLAGWIGDNRMLTSIQSNYIPIAPSTAISFLLLGAILIYHLSRPLSGIFAKVALILVVLVSIFGALEVVEFITGQSLNFEDLLILEVGTLGGVPMARMSPSTGAMFLLAGTALALMLLTKIQEKFSRTMENWAGGLSGLVTFTGMVFSVSYLFGAPLLYGGNIIPMALPTSISFLLLGVGLFINYSAKIGLSFQSLVTQIIVVVLALMFVLVLAIGAITYSITKQKLEAASISMLEALASARQATLLIQIDDYLDDLQSFTQPDLAGEVIALMEANAWDQKIIHDDLVSKMRRQVPALIHLNSAAIADLSGIIIAATTTDLEGLDISNHPNFALSQIRTIISDPYQEEGEYLIDFSLPLTDGQGNTIAVLMFYFNGSQILAITGDYTGLGETGETVLGKREGDFIYFLTPQRFNPELKTIQPASTSGERARPMIHATAGQSGTTTAFDYRSILVIAAYRPISSLGWGLVVKQDQVEAFAGVAQLRTNLLIGMVIVLLVATIIIIPAANTFVQPLKILELATREVAKGDLSISVPISRYTEVSKLAETFNDMVSNLRDVHDQLAKSNEELVSFAYVVSHDLKAPLRGISSLSEWLESDLGDSLTPDQREQIHLLRERVQRMNALINGLLEYSRVGREHDTEIPVDVDTLLVNIIDSISPPESIQIIVTSKMPRLQSGALHLTQVFQNLISNSVNYHPGPQGNIEISCRDDGNYWEFAVRDDGVGIEPRHHERIFQMFQSLQISKDVNSTGIGLALVRKIVAEHGGKAWVESQGIPGQGSIFRFTWPKIK